MEHNDDDSDSRSITLASLLYIRLQQSNRTPSIPSNRAWSGPEVVNNLLTCGNSVRIHSQLRMELATFFSLRDWLLLNTELKSSRFISIEEKLVIFIYITSTGVSNRAAQERFDRSARSISWYIITTIIIRVIS